MNKLTKLLSVFAVAGVLGAGVAISACGSDSSGKNEHKHTYDEKVWTTDEYCHWHAATCSHNDLKKDYAKHSDEDGDNKCDVCDYQLSVGNVEVTGVTLDKTSISLKAGESQKLKATVLPSDATNDGVKWESSDNGIADVSGGVVRALKKGTAVITVTTLEGNYIDSCTVEVTEEESTSVKVTQIVLDRQTAQLKVGEKTTLSVKEVLPANATNKGYVWASDDESKATVDNKGVVTAKAKGDVKIIVTALDGSGVKAICAVTISEATGGDVNNPNTPSGGEQGGENQPGTPNTPGGNEQGGEQGGENQPGTPDTPGGNEQGGEQGGETKPDTPDTPGGNEQGGEQGGETKPDTPDTPGGNEQGGEQGGETKPDTPDTPGGNEQGGEQGGETKPDTPENPNEQGLIINSEFMAKVYLKGASSLDDKFAVYVKDGEGNTTRVTSGYTVKASSYNLKAAGGYDVEISYGSYAPATIHITVIDKAPEAVDGVYTVRVDKNSEVENGTKVNGIETFKTVADAIDYYEACNLAAGAKKVVRIEEGVYVAKITTSLSNLVLIGEGNNPDDVKLSYSAVEDTVDIFKNQIYGLNCATLHINGAGFMAYNIAIHNDFDYIGEAANHSHPQGLALTINGDGAVISNCHLYGNQDTLYLRNGRTYFYKTQIDGNVDFIFGEATGLAYFEACDIKAISRNGGSNEGYVTAMRATEDNKPDYGYIFSGCHFISGEGVQNGSMSLGRPWGERATVAMINCDFTAAYSTAAYGDSSVRTHRWDKMSDALPTSADYVEYGSRGEGAITSPVNGGRILTGEQAAQYIKANIFAASNGKCKWAAVWNADRAAAELAALASPQKVESVTVSNVSETVVYSIKVIKDYIYSESDLSGLINTYLDGEKVTALYASKSQAPYIAKALTSNDAIYMAVEEVQITEKIYTLINEIASNTSAGSGKTIFGGDATLVSGGLNPNENSGCCIVSSGTVIRMEIAGEVNLVWYGGGTDSYGKASDAKIVYSGGKATITVGSRLNQFYLKQIEIDLSKIPGDTPAAITYDISFNLNGATGTAPGKQTVEEGECANAPAVPLRSGYEFLGWFDAAEGGNRFDFTKGVTKSVTLYAHWQQVIGTAYITETGMITFGSNGNYGNYLASTQLLPAEGAGIRDNGGNNCQVKGTITINVKAGAKITVSSYDGYTNYTVKVNGTLVTAEAVTGTSWEYTATADSAIDFVCGGNNYFYSIAISYPGGDVIEENASIIFGSAGNYTQYTEAGKVAIAGNININSDCIQYKSTLTIKVKAGASVEIVGYPGNAHYTVKVGDGAVTGVQEGDYSIPAVAADCTIVLTYGGSGNNYVKSITVTYA